MEDKRRALIALVLLSPLTAELLSGSSPPLEFFFPPGFLLLVGLYGSGVLLVRELALRWGKGWPSVLLLGAAYGILEEGLIVRSFFDPAWMDLGILGEYGRWAGINWVWSVWLTIFHGLVSIAVPIILVNLMYPSQKRARLTTDPQLLLPVLALVVITAISPFLFEYEPEAHLYSLAVLSMVLFGLAAYMFPRDWPKMKSDAPILPPSYFLAIGFLYMLFSLVIVYALPGAGLQPYAVIALLCLLSCGALWVLINSAGRGYNEMALLALVVGLLAPFIIVSFVHEANGIMGMSLVGISYAVYLFLLMVRVGRGAPEAKARKVPIGTGKDL
ncbi:MAG: hypothetical protein LN417_06185 [Candidatus Thermoplasmatota archaeon]|nr:hypothetical protein [Candidatus Thermoplasmatota archaeon]